MERRYFGTDGVRGVVGGEVMNADFVLRLGRAAGRVLGGGRGKVLIGRDTRASGSMLEAALTAGLLEAGVDVERVGVVPTPGLAYLIRPLGALAGAVISASHNPYTDNGVKFFGPEGTKIPDALEAEIEAALDGTRPAPAVGRLWHSEESQRRYRDYLLERAGDLSGLKILVDAANGATHALAPWIFSRAGAEVFAICVSPDGKNINRGCGATAPSLMARLVRELGFDAGVAFDGDGDRAVFADRHGRIVTGDHVLYLHALANRVRAVVGTEMTNLGLEKALARQGIELLRTKVGDRYVYERMIAEGLTLGGEPSGHVIFRDHAQTGDGLLTAALTFQLLKRQGRDLAEVVDELSLYPQLIENVRVTDKGAIMRHPELEALVEAARSRLGEGRINVRPSGTEPLVRVMVEGPDAALVSEVARWLAGELGRLAAVE